MTVDYSLSEQIHASAKLKDVTSVMLWLGADIMLEYGLEEAKALLVRIFSPVCGYPVIMPHESFCPGGEPCASQGKFGDKYQGFGAHEGLLHNR